MTPEEAPRPLLLLVDDQPSNLDTLVAMLEDQYDLAVSTSGAEALALLTRTRRPDLILLDVMMPDMDGYATCNALKAAPATRDIPVIFVTARDDAESESHALACGGVDFIHKPVNPDVLRGRVQVHLELARHRFQLESLVHERTLALGKALDEAEGSNRALRALLSNLSHELRTPLHQIMGINYLLEEHSTDGEVRVMLGQVRQSSEQLLHQVATLIDLAQIEAGSIQMATLDFDLTDLLERVAQDVSSHLPQQAEAVQPQLDPALPRRLEGDPVRIEQILQALLDNAVKFSNGQPVTLSAALVATTPDMVTVRFEIRDRGPGLPEALRSGTFDPFRMGDSSRTRAHRGLGLGLALAQRLVTLMAGTLALDCSSGEGTIARVELRLPVHRQPAPGGTAPGQVGPSASSARALARLRTLLRDRSSEARTLWKLMAPQFYAAAGEQAPELARAIETFNFETALRIIESVIAARPELDLSGLDAVQ